jgi:hypothetical protein
MVFNGWDTTVLDSEIRHYRREFVRCRIRLYHALLPHGLEKLYDFLPSGSLLQ